MRLSLLGLCLLVSLIAGCDRKPDPRIAFSGGPTFDPLTFFDGHTQSWGVIENRSGMPTERILTDCEGQTDATGRLKMIQDLSFQDGTHTQRDWTMWRSGPNRFDATANDMVGTAVGEVNGRVFHWQWVLARHPGDPLMDVTMNQWMYQMADGSVTVRTTVSKFGFIVAEVTEQFTHPKQS